jgi:predicted ATP-grasp superfamily ATP-dependent carboligase
LAGWPSFPVAEKFKERYYWYPVRDFKAYTELKKQKEIQFWDWIQSIAHVPVLPFFQWKDPLPTIKPFFQSVLKRITALFRMLII